MVELTSLIYDWLTSGWMNDDKISDIIGLKYAEENFKMHAGINQDQLLLSPITTGQNITHSTLCSSQNNVCELIITTCTGTGTVTSSYLKQGEQDDAEIDKVERFEINSDSSFYSGDTDLELSDHTIPTEIFTPFDVSNVEMLVVSGSDSDQ